MEGAAGQAPLMPWTRECFCSLLISQASRKNKGFAPLARVGPGGKLPGNGDSTCWLAHVLRTMVVSTTCSATELSLGTYVLQLPKPHNKGGWSLTSPTPQPRDDFGALPLVGRAVLA